MKIESSLPLLLVIGLAFASGCGQTPNSPPPQANKASSDKDNDGKGMAAAQKGTAASEKEEDAHSGWWCNEHGVPEGICGQCDSKVAADFQKKNDWCKEHDRPDSQCFTCHPELEAKFAAQYEAKYGKKPPKPEE